MDQLFHKIGSAIVGAYMVIAGFFGHQSQAPVIDTDVRVGATIPTVVAVFQTSLASSISASDTSMTLVLGTDKAGNSLSGYICFNLDEGTAKEEFVCGTTVGTAVTGMIRGIDPVDGITERSTLKKAHGRGASVKITNYPQLGILSRVLNGTVSVPNALFYASHPCTGASATTTICDKDYTDNVARQGAATSSNTVAGILKISTAAASANNPIAVGDNDIRLTGKSGTVLSSTNPPIDFLYTATTSTASKVVTSSSTGKIDTAWIDTGTTASQILKLDGSAKIPAVDGSQLTNISGILYSTTTPITVASSVTETNLASTTIPANTLITGGAVRMKIYVSAFAISGTANTSIFRLKYGGTTLATQTYSTNGTNSAGSGYTGYIEATIVATSTSAQKGLISSMFATGTFGNTAGTMSGVNSSGQTSTGNGTVDNTALQSLILSVQFSNNGASDNITTQEVIVEKIK